MGRTSKRAAAQTVNACSTVLRPARLFMPGRTLVANLAHPLKCFLLWWCAQSSGVAGAGLRLQAAASARACTRASLGPSPAAGNCFHNLSSPPSTTIQVLFFGVHSSAAALYARRAACSLVQDPPVRLRAHFCARKFCARQACPCTVWTFACVTRAHI